MKCILNWPVALAAGLITFSALGQEEQWLQYHKSATPHAYRWLELTTNPPPNVALPKVRNAALYGCWTNGFDSPRWICLDSAARSGPADRVIADCNGNGRLDDDTPLAANRRDGSMAYFDPLKFVFKGEEGPVSYHLVLRFYRFDADRAQLLVGSACWYEGAVTLAGKKRQFQIFDNNVNGIFNDIGDDPTASDRIILPGSKTLTRYLGKYLEVDDQLLKIEVAPDGAFIKVAKAEGVTMAPVRVPHTVSEFEAVGPNGHFVRKPLKGELSLPAGKYRVNGWAVDRKDAAGASWKLVGSGFTHAANFDASGDAASLDIGEPLRPVLQATETRGQVSFNLKLLGSLGESVQVMRGTDTARAPRLLIASTTGAFRSTNSFEYG